MKHTLAFGSALVLLFAAVAAFAFSGDRQRLPASPIDQNREYSNGSWHSVGQPDKPWR